MNCKVCKQQLFEEAKFCHQCGCSIKANRRELLGNCIVSDRAIHTADDYFRCAQCQMLCLVKNGFEEVPLCLICANETGMVQRHEAEMRARKETVDSPEWFGELFAKAESAQRKLNSRNRETAWRWSLYSYLEAITGRRECEKAFFGQYENIFEVNSITQRALCLTKAVRARRAACPDLVDATEIHALFERLLSEAGDKDTRSFVVSMAVETFALSRLWIYAKRWALKSGDRYHCDGYVELLLDLDEEERAEEFLEKLDFDEEDYSYSLYNYAEACAERGLVEKALSIRKRLDSDYHRAEVLASIGGHYAQSGQLQEAENALDHYQSSSGKNLYKTNAAGRLVVAYANAGEFEKAESFIGKVYSFHNMLIYESIVNEMVRRGEIDSVLNYLRRPMQLGHGYDMDDFCLEVAVALVNNDQFEIVKKVFDPLYKKFRRNDYETAVIEYHLRHDNVTEAEHMTMYNNYTEDSGLVDGFQTIARYHSRHRGRILPYINQLEDIRNAWCVSVYCLAILSNLYNVSEDFYSDLIN